MSIRHVLPTLWLSIQFSPLSYWWKHYSNGFGFYFATLSYGKTWLKDALHFTFWDRMFARSRFYKSSFFITSFRHQDSNSFYLVLATAKIPKIWKRSSLDVYFSICKSQDSAINRQWIIQPKLIDSPSETFFNFVIAPVLSTLNELVFSAYNCERNNKTWKAKVKFNEKFLLLYFRYCYIHLKTVPFTWTSNFLVYNSGGLIIDHNLKLILFLLKKKLVQNANDFSYHASATLRTRLLNDTKNLLPQIK